MAKKQTTIPGTERKTHDDVEKAAAEYVDVRDRRMALTKKEVEAKSKLAAAMKKHNLVKYLAEDDEGELEVVIEPGDEKLRVKRRGEED